MYPIRARPAGLSRCKRESGIPYPMMTSPSHNFQCRALRALAAGSVLSKSEEQETMGGKVLTRKQTCRIKSEWGSGSTTDPGDVNRRDKCESRYFVPVPLKAGPLSAKIISGSTTTPTFASEKPCESRIIVPRRAVPAGRLVRSTYGGANVDW